MNRRTRLLVAAFAAVATLLIAPAANACITTLPVRYSFPTRVASAYGKTLPITLSPKVTIRHFTVALYTFKGVRLASGRLKHALNRTRTIKMRLKFPLQIGKYTLVMYGFPNSDPSCGPKHSFPVVKFTGCSTRLNINFPNKPGGIAADYADFLTVPVQSKSGAFYRNLTLSLSNFDGEKFGSAPVKLLYGRLDVPIHLTHELERGSYTAYISGFAPDQPRSCGPKSAQTTLRFQ